LRPAFPRRALPAVVLAAAIAGIAAPAAAFYVGSGFYDPCHERMTGPAWRGAPLESPSTEVVRLSGDSWRALAGLFLEWAGIDPDGFGEAQQFALVSLIAGVRVLDNDGHSMIDLERLRQLNADPMPEGQCAHALRDPGDDYLDGDASAVTSTQELIHGYVEEAALSAARPPDEQLITISAYLDFYGRIELTVWEPAYDVGLAAHALQDSFSHMIRSDADNLRRVVHVMNFIDAITDDFDERRDGLAHSKTMDDCLAPELWELLNAATRATTDLLGAAREEIAGRDSGAMDAVLSRWLTLVPGCTLDDGLCGNERWLEIARREQTGPYVEELLGCSAAGQTGSGWFAASVLVLCASFVVRRLPRSRRSGPSAS
jgi:hypothetical protein